MEIEQLITICKERNELEFLFNITKQVAESDSIGEGYGYCTEYKREHFNNAEKINRGQRLEYCSYLEECSIKIYEMYLIQIGYFKTEELV